MKTVKLTQIALVAGLSFSALTVNAGSPHHTFTAGNQAAETKICMAAVKNDVKEYKKQVKNFPTFVYNKNRGHRVVANKLSCNSQNIAKLARMYGAKDTTALITKYLTRSISIRQDVAVAAAIDKNTPLVITATSDLSR